jgi:hypothetical protein
MNQGNLFKVGDRVTVVKYGHSAYVYGGDGVKTMFDAAPYLVGRVGTIAEVKVEGEEYLYAIDDIAEKYGWYNQEQLKTFVITVN